MADESEEAAAVDGPLWTETHAPSLADLPQPKVREHLRSVVSEPMNLLVHGPPGAGKTAAVRALADELHDSEADGDDLAESMDISRPTFHQHLRAAQRKVFEELFDPGADRGR